MTASAIIQIDTLLQLRHQCTWLLSTAAADSPNAAELISAVAVAKNTNGKPGN